MRRRENTFRIDYANVPRKPSFSDVHEFIGTVLGLKREDVVRVQCSKSLGCAFVKAVDLATAQKVVEEHCEMHDLVVDGKSYPLRIVMEDGAVEVKLSDLSEDVTSEAIAKFLSVYGDVISIHELLWGENYLFQGIPTGIRVARMMVKTNIPSFVTIDGEKTSVFYPGQCQTCRHCGEFVHNGVSCVHNKKLLMQKLAADQSYAKVAKQTKPTGSNAVPKPLQPVVELPKVMGPPKPVEPLKPKSNASSNQSEPSKPTDRTGGAPKKPMEKSEKLTLFQLRSTNTNDKTQLQTTTEHDDDERMEDGDESDGSSASAVSKDSRSRRNPKKQKTAHGDSSQVANK